MPRKVDDVIAKVQGLAHNLKRSRGNAWRLMHRVIRHDIDTLIRLGLDFVVCFVDAAASTVLTGLSAHVTSSFVLIGAE